MRVCIMQSNYLPWKGYFDLICHSDRFVFLDDVQYTKKSWRNRNRIKAEGGPAWLTVPVNFRLSQRTPIQEVRVADRGWAAKHRMLITRSYRNAPFFEETVDWLWPMLEKAGEMNSLSEINQFTLKEISSRLRLATRFMSSSELMPRSALESFEHNSERIVMLTKAAGGEVCLNGPTGKAYTDEDFCHAHGVSMIWADYSSYPEYPQLHGEFRHDVSIIDMFMMLGQDTMSYMKAIGFAERDDGGRIA